MESKQTAGQHVFIDHTIDRQIVSHHWLNMKLYQRRQTDTSIVSSINYEPMAARRLHIVDLVEIEK